MSEELVLLNWVLGYLTACADHGVHPDPHKLLHAVEAFKKSTYPPI